MRVLNLVTTPESRFFTQQVETLRERGVASETLAVPGDREFEGGNVSERSVVDYLRFVPQVVRASFGDYDLIHANYGLTAPAALAQPNLPVVLSLWGTDLMGKYGWLSERCARRCDAVVVMSEDMADRLDCAATVIPHGVDLERFQPRSRESARAELGWSDEARHVLFPYPRGRAVKDYPRARRVVDRVAERLAEDVRLQTVSGVPHERMPVYLNAADCLLLTSRREGSPNAVKEAMACNVPVVSTDVGDVAERLGSVSNSYVCASDASLVESLHAVLKSDGRSDGRDAAREISFEETARRLEAVYERIRR